eukprot:SAG31_NODE_337_length_17493_cov_5.855755_19_plen_792_part_00
MLPWYPNTSTLCGVIADNTHHIAPAATACLQEARKRNPKIKTYALAWAAPWWVGNQTGWYSDDQIDYQLKWLNCTKQHNIGNVDFIGNWNERAWGGRVWNNRFKKAMESAGFANTAIIVPDGGGIADIEQAMDTDGEFRATMQGGGVGLHYPCNYRAPEVQQKYGLKYWSAEDYSTVGDWAGAACWGRLLNQNFVRMNMTSTIAWSLVWSVYGTTSLTAKMPYYGNGLMYAFTPWSGYFEAGQDGTDNGAAIWTNAHTCQFVEPGWSYLANGKGSGYLADGGSYVTLVSPNRKSFTVVLEKLEGMCLRCAGQTTKDEAVRLILTNGLEEMHGGELQLWRTNRTARFISEGNISVAADHSINVIVRRDSIITISSWYNGQAKVLPKVPAPAKFPLPYKDDFDSYTPSSEAKYFADNGGSFQIEPSPVDGGSGNMVMKQAVMNENGVNRWAPNVQPMTLIGDAGWSDVKVTVDVLIGSRLRPTLPGPLRPPPPPLPPPSPSPPPAPRQGYFNVRNTYSGECLDVIHASWSDGDVVDVYPCIEQANEKYKYDAVTGQLIVAGSGKCVVWGSGQCTPAVGSPTVECLQIRPCTNTSSRQQQLATTGSDVLAWTIDANLFPTFVTIRPKGNSSMCLQVKERTQDAAVTLAPCSGIITDRQRWAVITRITPVPAPTPPPAPPPPPPSPGVPRAGTCVRTTDYGVGVCLCLGINGTWTLSAPPSMGAGKLLSGKVAKDVTKEWTRLGIVANGSTVTASIDGKLQAPPLTIFNMGGGMVSINSGWNEAYFDNFAVDVSV